MVHNCDLGADITIFYVAEATMQIQLRLHWMHLTKTLRNLKDQDAELP